MSVVGDLTVRLANIEQSLNQFLNLHGLSLYNTEIINVIKSTETKISENSLKIQPYASITLFPSVGDEKTIYIETTNKKLYLWDSKHLKYYCFGSDYNNIKVINGGSSKEM